MRKRWLIYMLLILLPANRAGSQEIVTGLLFNRQLAGVKHKPQLKSTKGNDTLLLPFIDDFSGDSLFPSPYRWTDRLVFVNNTYSVKQPSLGIATFDCLDENGKLYENASYSVFAADRLTSKPIDLSYLPGDSIYLSFLYEAGGIADLPERDDSLTLSFWAPDEEMWYSVWRAEGGATDGFKTVMMPVKEARYLKKGFRFMFTGHASLSKDWIENHPGRAFNGDQWNIDHVMLDRDRSRNDTVLHDVALTLPQRSLIKDYEAMPWLQFRQAYLSVMSPTATINYRNNDTIVRNVTRHVSIKDILKNVVVRDFDAGATNVSPLTDIKYDAPLLYTYNSSSTDSALFLVTVSLITDDFDPKTDDTIKYLQRFTDYFAVDDGTAEAGYGVNGQGTRNAMVALQFRSFIADSVKALDICFNDAYDNANQRSFDIMVWADDNGKPGVLLGTTEGPVAMPSTDINGFVTYPFEKPVSVSGPFWVGWKQLSETFLNAGLDLNTYTAGRHYYSLSGTWEPSQAQGTVMLRPVMKGEGSSTSSDEGSLVNDLFRIYPNPSRGQVTLVASDRAPDDFIIEVLSATGASVRSLDRTDRPDFSSLSPGTYIIIIKTREGKPLSIMRLIRVK
jgi:hypothetical protein